jgi:SOS response regulatory protein OraA/RecX
MTMDEQKELRSQREHRELKKLRSQLSIEIARRSLVEQLLHECLRNRYFDEHRCSPSWLSDVQAAFGERR